MIVGKNCRKGLTLEVLKSGAGYYIGTTENDLPYCRCSSEYYKTKEHAEQLGSCDRGKYAIECLYCNKGRGCIDE